MPEPINSIRKFLSNSAGKSIPLFLILVLIGTIVGIGLNWYQQVKATDVGTSVTVSNAAPSFTVDPHEDPASYADSPTNAGSDVTFKATADDPNGENWYLAVCKTNSVSPTDDGAPTCPGGAWCISSATADGSEASCSYTTQDSDSESNEWYAFACDGNSSDAKCSSVSQGSGDSGTPFKVNHRPSFTAFSDDSPKDPGQTVTWTATASDSDTDGTADTVTLYVCKANDFTGTACGAGGEWCHSTATSSNPSCSYTLPTPYQDKDYNAYGFVIDNHNFAASGGSQGTDSTLTVNNVAPSVSNIQLLDTDESGDLTLTIAEGETTGFKVKFTVTDNNSCQNATGGDEIVSAIVNVYRSGIGQASCQASGDYNANNCYPDAYADWNPTCSQDAGTCNGSSDSDANWTCTFPLQYHADPTVTGSQYSDENWLASVQVTDDDSATSTLIETTAGNEMAMFMAYDVIESSIAYGSVSPGDTSSQQETTVKATGNVGLDENLSGTDMTSGANTIAVGQQEHSFTSGFSYGTGTDLTTTSTEYELNCPKTTNTANPATKKTYWLLQVPSDTPAGTYSGTNTIEGVTGESADW